MTNYQISVQPSGHAYQIAANETVLEAAIVAGITLPYGCRNGACGACKGKILQGQVDHGQHSQSALSQADKDAGFALFCCAKPLSDLVIECREATLSGGIKPRILPVRVQQKTLLAPDVMLLLLKLPSNERLQFIAGQYIEFILKDGKRRAFSLANAPQDDEFLQLHLRLIPNGTFTQHVFNEMQEKAILRVEGPFGSFFLREDSDKPIIFVAGGTGFAPIKSIIEHILHHTIQRELHLYWGAKSLQDMYMMDLPQRWAEQYANIRFTPVLSEPRMGDEWQGATGLVHQAVLNDYDDLSQQQVYCCGAPPMVEIAKETFIQRGLPEHEFFFDAFTYATHTTA